jgi:AcrR family transcriptional regulator
MTQQEANTEKKILDAAKTVFQKKGMDGARMQEIADKAGINKSLLHYYFRSKEKLFERVFDEAFILFFMEVKKMLMSDMPIIERLTFFISSYLDMLQKNPHIPAFVINEINRNPDILVKLFRKSIEFTGEDVFDVFQQQIDTEAGKGKIRKADIRHLVVNIIAMCVFPMISRPIVQGTIFGNNAEMFEKFLLQRKKEITEFVTNAIKIEHYKNN